MGPVHPLGLMHRKRSRSFADGRSSMNISINSRPLPVVEESSGNGEQTLTLYQVNQVIL